MKDFSDLELVLSETLLRQSDQPLYLQIYKIIRQAILDRVLRTGTRLPSTRSLALNLGVSRNTILVAFEQLIAEGYITTTRGSGTFVAKRLPDDLLQTRFSTAITSPKHNSSPKISRRGKKILDAPFTFSPTKSKLRAFQPGFTAIDEFPMNIWSRCLTRYLRKMPRINLDYGNIKGYRPLREAISRYLGASRGVRCEPEQIFIVGGSQQGLDLSARILVNEGDEVWIEDPGYMGARGALIGAGANSIPVPIDSEGLSVSEGERRSKAARAIYVTPSHQFPLGIVMSLARRLELLEYARKTSSWIIEDDYDSEFRYGGKPLSSLQGLDRDQRVIYIGTLSKVMFPSLRLGYLVVPANLVETFYKTMAFSTHHPPLLEQIALTDFINDGHFMRHIRRMRGIYAQRQSTLVDSAERKLSDFLKVEKQDAGMHLIGWLKKDLNDMAVAKLAIKNGVYAAPLSFYCIAEKLPDGLLLGYTGVNETEIHRGVSKLRDTFRNAF